MELLLWIIGLGLIFAGPAALGMVYQSSSRIKQLEAEISKLREIVFRLESRLSRSTQNEQTVQEEKQSVTPAPKNEPTPAPQPDSAQESTEQQKAEPASAPSYAAKKAKPDPSKEKKALPFITEAKRRDFTDMEDDLSSKWMVWLGGLALALGGGFIVKYSIDAGLLGPTTRVVLGCITGVLLLLAGEFARQKGQDAKWLSDAPDYVPQALAGAGLFTLFASVLSAYSLYSLLSPPVTFLLLAAISLGATFAAMLHGRFFAYLGLIGGLVVPILVSTGSGNPWALFPYLLFVVASTLYAARSKQWIDVAATGACLALLWVPLWVITSWHTSDGLPVGLYILILLGLVSNLLSGATPERSTDASAPGMAPVHPVSIAADCIHLAGTLLLVMIVRLEHYDGVIMTLYAAYMVGIGYLVTKDAEFDLPAIFAFLGSLFLLSVWHVPDLVELETILQSNEAVAFAIASIAPPGFEGFATAAVALAGGVGLFAYFCLPILLRKPLWATIGTLYPVLVLILAYGRLNDFDTSIPFAGIASALAILAVLAIKGLRKPDTGPDMKVIAAYAAGASTFIALALAMALRDAWLSFAIALEVAALAYIWKATAVSALRTFALLGTAIVLVRLFANAAIFDYGGGESLPIVNWLFYGYAGTAALFAWAACIFGKTAERDRLYSLLVLGSLFLAVGFITLEIRVLASETGRLASAPTELELALQTINWTSVSALFLWREVRDGDPLFGVMRRIMTAASIGAFIIAGGMFNNIFIGGTVEPGMWPLINIQLLQYFIPACLFTLKAKLASDDAMRPVRKVYGTVSLIAIFVWITSEVRLFFLLSGEQRGSEWEIYSYSLVWLLYAVALIVAGLKTKTAEIRHAGLGLLGIVVLKVFLGDLSNLDGVARALSFMGLGLALIGLGYLYRKLRRVEHKPS